MSYKDAINIVTKELKAGIKDKTENTVYHSFQANIAMCFKDGYANWKRKNPDKTPTSSDIHEIANKASTEFLNRLINAK